jgi:hypothetical protein
MVEIVQAVQSPEPLNLFNDQNEVLEIPGSEVEK